jgi:hypothetical protein
MLFASRVGELFFMHSEVVVHILHMHRAVAVCFFATQMISLLCPRSSCIDFADAAHTTHGSRGCCASCPLPVLGIKFGAGVHHAAPSADHSWIRDALTRDPSDAQRSTA